MAVFIEDRCERLIKDALDTAKIRFVTGDKTEARLDFYLPDHDVHIEVKQFHSDRIGNQMARASNVIAVQGIEAIKFLADALSQFDRGR